MVPCLACEHAQRSDRGDDDRLVARTATGYVRVHELQYHLGYTLFVAKTCADELHHLPPDERSAFLEEMALVAEAVSCAFAPHKLNIELLGNSVRHLHWHVVPRHADDPWLRGPIWEDHAYLQALWSKQVSSAEAIDDVKARLRAALVDVGIAIEM